MQSRMAALFRELVNDPPTRARLRAALGFCPRHTREALRQGDALGLSILYADLMAELLARLHNAAPASAASRRPACPECGAEQADTAEIAEAFAAYLAEPEMQDASRGNLRLCGVHLLTVMQAATPEARTFILGQVEPALQSLLKDLSEFIRKSDARFRHEGFGAEGDAYLRAARYLTGTSDEDRHSDG